jgi:aspartyl-tRNA(Asn)/glutamyl-tRNA(Gln) amidotransferase subunit C
LAPEFREANQRCNVTTDTTLHKTACIIAAAKFVGYLVRLDIPDRPVSLTKEQVQHIAILARLQLEDDEFDDVVSKLSKIVDFVDQLQAAPTENVVPMAHPLNMSLRLRADDITEADNRDTYQENAPSVESGYYLVPRVIE